MKKEFCVTVDVTMSGDIHIEAENEQEARKLISEKYFTPSDLSNFHCIDKEIYEVEGSEA